MLLAGLSAIPSARADEELIPCDLLDECGWEEGPRTEVVCDWGEAHAHARGFGAKAASAAAAGAVTSAGGGAYHVWADADGGVNTQLGKATADSGTQHAEC